MLSEVKPSLISLGKDNYSFIRLSSVGEQGVLFWLWGKIDFRSYYLIENGSWHFQKVCLFRRDKEYLFERVTNHGTMFEESLWRSGGESLHIELPVHFSINQAAISQKMLEKAFA